MVSFYKSASSVQSYDLHRLHAFVKGLEIKISDLADSAKIKPSTLKQFLYNPSNNPQYSKTSDALKKFVDSRYGYSYLINVMIHGDEISSKTKEKLIGNFIFYRKSLYIDRISKINVIIKEIGGILIFDQFISGLNTERRIIGKVGRYSQNIYLKGLAFSMPNFEDNNTILEDKNIIGEEIISFLENDLNSDYIVVNFFSFTGPGETVCGNGILIKEKYIDSINAIGNIKENNLHDRFKNILIVDLIKKSEEKLNFDIKTISYRNSN